MVNRHTHSRTSKRARRAVIAPLALMAAFALILSACDRSGATEIPSSPAHEAVTEAFRAAVAILRPTAQTDLIAADLLDWAAEHDFHAVRDKAGNVIIEKPAAEEFETLPVTLLHSRMDMIPAVDPGVVFDPRVQPVPLEFDEKSRSFFGDGMNMDAAGALGVATIKYVLENARESGPVRAIFTVGGSPGGGDAENARGFFGFGARNLDADYLSGDLLINVNHTSDARFCVGSSAAYAVTLSRETTRVTPASLNAFVLAADGFRGVYCGEDAERTRPNPIKVLAEILSLAKGEGIVFELASFESGVSETRTPDNAAAVVLLNDYELKRFRSLLKKYESDFADKYRADAKSAALLFAETKMPERCLSFDSTGEIISVLYGIPNGVSARGADGAKTPTALSEAVRVSAQGEAFTVTLRVLGANADDTTALLRDLESIARLCGADFQSEPRVPAWRASASDAAARALSVFTAAFDDITRSENRLSAEISVPATELGFFAEKAPDLAIVSIGGDVRDANSALERLRGDTVSLPALVILRYLEARAE